MRSTTFFGLLLACLVMTPAFCQSIPGMPDIPTVPEPAPLIPQPSLNLGITIEPSPAPVPEYKGDFECLRTWSEQRAEYARQAQLSYQERVELVDRRIFIYEVKDPYGNPAVPEPSSLVAMAGGLSGLAMGLIKKRRSK